ncbi:unnamed protein product, partial [Nesidiocoris tenuis]
SSHRPRALRLAVRYLRARNILYAILDVLEWHVHRTALHWRAPLQREYTFLRLARKRRWMSETSCQQRSPHLQRKKTKAPMFPKAHLPSEDNSSKEASLSEHRRASSRDNKTTSRATSERKKPTSEPRITSKATRETKTTRTTSASRTTNRFESSAARRPHGRTVRCVRVPENPDSLQNSERYSSGQDEEAQESTRMQT